MLFVFAFWAASHITSQPAGAPPRQPQMAVDGQRIALTYGAANAIYFTASSDEGKSFSKPVRVSTAPFTPLGRHRGPRIAITRDALVISAITGTERFKDGDLLSWRSTDGGKTWSAAAKISDVPRAAREGLHSMAAGRDGALFTTWLDLRSGAMKLYGSVSRDAGKSWSANFPIYDSPDGHICECCHPSALIGAGGELRVMWRNWLKGSRDMYTAVSTDGGKTFTSEKLGQGTWPLNACPMDGGGIALDSAGRPHTAWRRADTVYYAAPGVPEVAIGPGKDVALALAGDGPYMAWSEGAAIKIKTPAGGARILAAKGGYVTLVGSGPVYAAWETEDGVMVERVSPR